MKKTNEAPAAAPTEITPELQVQTKAEQFMKDATALQIADDAKHVEVLNTMGVIKALKDKAELDRDLLLNPAEATVKAIKNRWNPGIKFLESALATLRGKYNIYTTKKEDDAKKALEKVDEKIASGAISRPETIEKKRAEAVAMVRPTVVFGGGATGSNRKVPDFEITDRDKIPDEYWVLDEVKLRKAITKDKIEVPGAKLIYKNSVAIF